MRIAICDDCRQDAAALCARLKDHRVSVFSCADELLNRLEEQDVRYDLYLLDIYMEDTPVGIQLAKRLRELDSDADICFISSSDMFYREAYDLQDVNYILKPVDDETFDSLIRRTIRKQKRTQLQTFHYKWNGQMESIPYGNILFFAINGHSLDIHCKDGTEKHCIGKLGDVEMMLDERVFRRCHQSFLVNLYHVDHLTGHDLILGAHRVPISRRYLNDVRTRYQEILFEEMN